MIDKSITSLSDVEINALEQIINESNFYNSITVAESPFSSIAVFDDNDVICSTAEKRVVRRKNFGC